jgi:hypothetical protein
VISVFAAVSLFLLSSSSIERFQPYSVVARIAGIAILVLPVVWRRRLKRSSMLPKVSHSLAAAGMGYCVYLVAANVFHNDSRRAVFDLLALTSVVLLTYSLLHYYTHSQVLRGVGAALFAVCAVSLFLALVQPGIGLENSRLRGVIENANGLGFIAFTLGAMSLGATRSKLYAWTGLLVALSCLVLSGSRASALAFMILTVGFALGGVRRAQTVALGGAIVAILVWLAQPEILSQTLLFRTTDTRSLGLQVMRQVLDSSFWLGEGPVASDKMIAGSPFIAGISAGVVGLLALALMYVGMLTNLRWIRPRALVLAVAAIVHSFFESWMLSFSAPMLLTFFVALVALAGVDEAESIRAFEKLQQRRRKARPVYLQ